VLLPRIGTARPRQALYTVESVDVEKLSGAELAAEVAALKALVVTLAEMLAASHREADFKTRLLNGALSKLRHPMIWNAPRDPSDELRTRASARCQEIVDVIG
jgi:hypothetical protein